MHVRRPIALLALAALAVAGSPRPATPAADAAAGTTSAQAAGAQSSQSGAPRVYFIEPKDGQTVKSPVRLRFGLDNYKIAPVPEGTVEKARPGVGHHHVGIDVDCLPPNTEIVRGTPSWVHFGDGKSEIDMQLTPGSHKLTLQFADDLHRTIEGLCQTITVNVVE